jgi:hypothetical protein
MTSYGNRDVPVDYVHYTAPIYLLPVYMADSIIHFK